MNPLEQAVHLTRRRFFTSTASGLGLVALGSLLQQDGLLAAPVVAPTDPLFPKPPHFAPRAKNCIFIFMEGAPSQLDLFDPKPKLNELDGQPLPDSLLEKVRFAFIKKETVRLMGSPRKFAKHGRSGMEFSDLLPNLARCADDLLMVRSMHTDQFNHHPAQLLLHCGRSTFGLPTMGAWLNYGLGSEARDLPGYVVLSAGRGTSGGSSLWQSGFLPSVYAGVPFRSQGDAVLNLRNPEGLPASLQRAGLDTLAQLNQLRLEQTGDAEIASRISAYELAFRMQRAAPELIDLSKESPKTLERYGVNRPDPPMKAERAGGPGQYRGFATNCLLARRLVERGVRFVNVLHASWDHHSNLDTELTFNTGMSDQPVAALIEDLKERGLLDETLIVWCGEFGRTPLGENRPGYKKVTGRDHHPNAFTVLLAGGGVKGGLTYGETDEIGWNVVRDPVHINDLHATILHLFGLDHLRLTHRYQGRDFRLTDVAGKVVRELLA
jgi:hypothetical protein